jgi:PAS domain S-box-containing protein
MFANLHNAIAKAGWFRRYTGAVLITFAALACNFLPAMETLPFFFFFAAVTLSARFCGFGPGVFSTVLSAALADYFLLPPRFHWSYTQSDFVRLGLFIAVGVLISSIARQRSHSERVADKHRATLAAIVESTDDAIMGKTLDGVITSWNRGAEKMYGYRADEVIGRHVSLLAPPGSSEEIRAEMQRLREGEAIDHFETERITKAGERITVSLCLSPLRDPHGGIIGVSSVARDITGRKLAEEALRRSEKLAATGRLAATIAHEINNPLEAITNLLYIAKTSPAKTQRYIELAEQELEHVAIITRQTLGFYRDTSAPAWLNIADLTRDVLSLYARKLQEKSIAVESRLAEDARVYGFAGELRQVFANLLTNAIDALPEGGRLAVRVSTCRSWKEEGPAGVRITLADTGSGIPVERRESVFEPFYTTKKQVGTGLGLWVTKSIVEKHGGSICVRSRTTPGRCGTVFSLFFPESEQARAFYSAAHPSS